VSDNTAERLAGVPREIEAFGVRRVAEIADIASEDSRGRCMRRISRRLVRRMTLADARKNRVSDAARRPPCTSGEAAVLAR
jgi:hypothetical protein